MTIRFRTTFVSEDFAIKPPEWFKEKYDWVNFSCWNGQAGLGIASPNERKFYSNLNETELFVDIQKVLHESDFDGVFTIVLLHECGGVTLVKITKDNISGREPVSWKEVDRVEHDYCYGCSDIELL